MANVKRPRSVHCDTCWEWRDWVRELERLAEVMLRRMDRHETRVNTPVWEAINDIRELLAQVPKEGSDAD